MTVKSHQHRTGLRALLILTVTFAVLSSIHATAAENGTPLAPELQEKLFAGCQAVLRGVTSLTFAAKLQRTYAQAYLEQNPQSAWRDHLLIEQRGTLADERYRVSSIMTQADGTRIPEYIQTFDGKQHNYFSVFGGANLFIRHTYQVNGDTAAFRLGTTVLLPYTFLYVTDDDYFVPNLSITRVLDRAAWNAACKQARVLSTLEGAALVRIRLSIVDGSSYVVTFSTDDDYCPIGFEEWGPSGLAQHYVAQEFATAEKDGVRFRYPKKATFETFLHGWPRETLSVEITSLAVNPGTDGVAFTIDRGTARQIYDTDKNE